MPNDQNFGYWQLQQQQQQYHEQYPQLPQQQAAPLQHAQQSPPPQQMSFMPNQQLGHNPQIGAQHNNVSYTSAIPSQQQQQACNLAQAYLQKQNIQAACGALPSHANLLQQQLIDFYRADTVFPFLIHLNRC